MTRENLLLFLKGQAWEEGQEGTTKVVDTRKCTHILSLMLSLKDKLRVIQVFNLESVALSEGGAKCRDKARSASRTRSTSRTRSATRIEPFSLDEVFFRRHLLEDDFFVTFSSRLNPEYQDMMIERYGYRRTILTFSMETCERCGERNEITFLNVIEGSNICRRCWFTESTLCTVEYAKIRFNLDDDDISSMVILPVDNQRVLELIQGSSKGKGKGKGKGKTEICSLRAAHGIAKEKAELEAEPFLQDRSRKNVFETPQVVGGLWQVKKHLGLVHLHKPTPSDAALKVVCSRLSLEKVKALQGCSDVETVTDNLYIALFLATPHTQSTETSFCFGIVKVGVEMDCNMEQMFTSLRGDQVRQLRDAGILDSLEFKGVEQEASIHCGNVRVVGVKRDRKPIIELMGRNAIFVSRFLLHVQNVQFFDGGVCWEKCLRDHDNNAIVTMKGCENLIIVPEGRGDGEHGDGERGDGERGEGDGDGGATKKRPSCSIQ
ncbi:hypothetical protein TrCOL_g10961 [Triparma columacea]|uniref:Uncharacterized protein n=1 Tax=Triparma columacea TaxID=722753 RepID=A0A9W7L616_9STRA|nr:hypothetical protein TrCOL_g10961 [Triparma columacea]